LPFLLLGFSTEKVDQLHPVLDPGFFVDFIDVVFHRGQRDEEPVLDVAVAAAIQNQGNDLLLPPGNPVGGAADFQFRNRYGWGWVQLIGKQGAGYPTDGEDGQKVVKEKNGIKRDVDGQNRKVKEGHADQGQNLDEQNDPGDAHIK